MKNKNNPKPKFISQHGGRVKNPKLVLVEDDSVPEGFGAVTNNNYKEIPKQNKTIKQRKEEK